MNSKADIKSIIHTTSKEDLRQELGQLRKDINYVLTLAKEP